MEPKPIGATRGRRKTATKRAGSGPPKQKPWRASASSLREQIDRACSALEAGLEKDDLTEFYSVLRATDLPFVTLVHEGDPLGLVRACRDMLHRLGGISPAVALAVENHLYVTSALATFPVQDVRLEASRRAILGRMGRERLLVANTNSRVHADKLGTLGTLARREGDGFRISGSAAYTSLATNSDLLVLLTRLENEGAALFVAPLRDQPGIEIGPFLFPNAMLDSDTRRLEFRDLFVPESGLLLAGRTEQIASLFSFELAWHQVLIPALYLGAAARAIEEARIFLRSVRAHDGRPLAELDGMVVDTGRLAIRYEAARTLLDRAVEELGRLAQGPLDPEKLAETFTLAGAAKYVGTTAAEEIVTRARRIVGARSFTGGHPLERLSQETPFGPLGPEVNAFIERHHGRRVLGEKPFHIP